MKVLQINAVCGIRSTGRICVEIADYLNNYCYEGYIAYSYGLPYKREYKIGTPFEIKLHSLLSRVFGLQAYFSKHGTLKLIKYMRKIKPDVVHLHNLHGNYINLKLLLTYLAQNNIPTVLTLHDCWFYTGKCCHYTIEKCYKWQSGCFNCPRIFRDNPSWFLDRTKKTYKNKKEWFQKIPRLAVVGVSDWITSEARKSFLSNANILTRIYNWIDLDVFRPVDTVALRHKLTLENKFVILGVASEWNDAKGINKFIELSAKIPKCMIIIIVGNIPTNLELPGNIIHIQETHDVRELVEYYSLASVFLNLSAEETFGKVSAEALACGTPVIAYRSTANPELVGEGCGYIVENRDIDSIYDAILKVHKRDKKYYSENCIAFAKAKFNKENRIADYAKLYQELLNLTIRRSR